MRKYNKEQRLDIGRRVVEHELTYAEAANEYGISFPSVANYVREYKTVNNITADGRFVGREDQPRDFENIEALSKMTKDELINEVIKAKIEEARAKKGYTVKGGGRNKEFVILNSESTK